MRIVPALPSVFRIMRAPRNVKLIALQQFFEGFLPIYALFAIMFDRVGGLNLAQIGLLFSLFWIAYTAGELPSGILADYWSRRKVIMLGGILRCAGMLFWILSPNFLGYAIGIALWGLMIACSSGATTAYLHNELKAGGQEQLFAKYLGWVLAIYSVGTLFGFGISAIFTLKHHNLLIGLSAGGSLAFSLFMLAASESPYKKQDTYLKTLRAGFSEVRRSSHLRYICYVVFSIYMLIGVIEELLTRLYAAFGLGETAISLVVAFSLLVAVLLLTRLESLVKFSLTKQVLVMCGAIVLSLAGLYLGGLGGVGLLLLFSLVFQLFRPVFQHHIQTVTKGDERATIGSIPGLISGVFGAGAFALIGLVAEQTSERFSIGAYCAIWLLVLLLLAWRGRKYSELVQ